MRSMPKSGRNLAKKNWSISHWRSSRSTVGIDLRSVAARSQGSISHTRSVKPVIAAHHRKDRSDAQHEEDHPLCIHLYLRIRHGNACPASKYAPYETAAGGAG